MLVAEGPTWVIRHVGHVCHGTRMNESSSPTFYYSTYMYEGCMDVVANQCDDIFIHIIKILRSSNVCWRWYVAWFFFSI